jgi:hypothetical protein
VGIGRQLVGSARQTATQPDRQTELPEAGSPDIGADK